MSGKRSSASTILLFDRLAVPCLFHLTVSEKLPQSPNGSRFKCSHAAGKGNEEVKGARDGRTEGTQTVERSHCFLRGNRLKKEASYLPVSSSRV